MSGVQFGRFSTDFYPVHERVDAWSDALGRHCGVHIDLDARSAKDFRSSATFVRASNVTLIEGMTSPNRQESSPSSIVNDDVTFCGVLTSRWGMSQLGRSLTLEPGDWSLLSNGDASAITLPEECRYLAFSVPRVAIMPRVADIGATFAHRISRSTPALQMLVRYLDLARRDNVVTTPELAAAFAEHVCDLLTLALGPTRDATEQARTRGVLAARLQAIKDDIARSLGRPDLSVHTVAARHGVSARYVQRLFEAEGTTFSEFLLRERLALAYRRLRDPVRAKVAISTIALSTGFNDVSYFNRCFRRRFGVTPREVRAAALPSAVR